MLTQISLRDNKKLLRIVWFNENKDGIYSGYYGQLKGTHYSYHIDGKFHYWIDNKEVQPSQWIRFSKIKIIQAPFQSIPLKGNIELIGSSSNINGKPNKLIVLECKDFSSKDQISIMPHLIKIGYESKLLNQVGRLLKKENFPFNVVGIEFIKLEYFSNLKLVVVFLEEAKRKVV